MNENELLKVKGIDKATAKRMAEKGITSIPKIAEMGSEELKATLEDYTFEEKEKLTSPDEVFGGISLKQAEEIIQNAKEIALKGIKLTSAEEYSKRE
jgi:hypothetical protein